MDYKMKQYLLIYKEFNNRYYNLTNTSNTSLRFLRSCLSDDYKTYDKELFANPVNCYDTTFVYNDLENNIFYIGCAEWEIDEEVDSPDYEDFPDYVNESNSCKISHENFKEFVEHWLFLKKELPPFALIYRDESDWIHCQGFQSEKEMEQFVKDYKSETIH